jgi:hypothetical protein
MQVTAGPDDTPTTHSHTEPASATPLGRGRAILFYDTGELGNRLVSYSYLLAYSAEHRVSVTNLCFWRYADLFDRQFSFCERAWIPLSIGADKKSLTEQFLGAVLAIPILRGVRRRFLFDGRVVCSPRSLTARSLVALATRFKSAMHWPAKVFGLTLRVESQWQHQCSLLVSSNLNDSPSMDPALPVKYADLLRAQFRLANGLQDRLAPFLKNLRARHERLIGVHIRLGDYSKYRDGQWLFDISTYHRLVTYLASIFPGASVGFLISTNGSLPSNAFAGLNAYPAPGHLALDMYALAACDLIVGPPSTFSGWASFIGNTPIYFMENAERLPTPAELTEVWTPQFY